MATDINKLALWFLGALLMGYAFLSKGFAYIGVPPLFIGEIALAVILAATLVGGLNLRIFRAPLCWILVIFLMWQVAMVITGPPAKIMVILRDSVIWGYAIFAFLTAGLLLRTQSIGKAVQWYGWWFPWFIVWSPIGYFLFVRITGNAPVLSEVRTDVGLLFLKPGDLGVHLAGAAAFLALGLHRTFPARSLKLLNYKELFWWCALAAGVIAMGSRNRGGLLSVVVAVTIVFLLRPNNRLRNFILPAALVGLMFVAFDVRIPIGGEREISVQQIASNIESIFVGTERRELSETSSWRIKWWKQILDDTVYGENFWTGMGYGTDIASRHGFADQTGNRSPHNGHLTLLARSGVPGLALWLILIGALYLSLFRCFLQAQHDGNKVRADLNIWLMAYFSAFFINTSVDVYLEGPQGGIWFWSVVGFALAFIYSQELHTKRRVESAAANYSVRQ